MLLEKVNMKIRKATAKDLDGIIRIYNEIHTREEAGEVTTGWLRDVYPVEKTAADSIDRGDMFVQEKETGEIVGTGIIRRRSMCTRTANGSIRRQMKKSWCCTR